MNIKHINFLSEKRTVDTEAGFSLIELMTVVAIIGILVALAIPKFSIFQGKARQAEAKTNLGLIYTLATAYGAEKTDGTGFTGASITTAIGQGACGGSNFGFSLPGKAGVCNSFYLYSDNAAATQSTFGFKADGGSTAATNRIFPGCATGDLWKVEESSIVTDVNSAAKNC